MKNTFPTRRTSDVDRIEAEGAHAVRVIGLADRFLGLNRVHETQGRARQRPRDEPHLGDRGDVVIRDPARPQDSSEEHTSELQSLLRISSAVFFLKNHIFLSLYLLSFLFFFI